MPKDSELLPGEVTKELSARYTVGRKDMRRNNSLGFKKYIMITHWENHWDAIPNQETCYPKKYIRFEPIAENVVEKTATLFIKLDKKTRKPDKAWVGHVSRFKDKGNKICFKVNVERQVLLADIPERYLLLKEGWYLENWYLKGAEALPREFALYPPFLYPLLTTEDWREFEDHAFWLLKLIGIHRLHRFEKQRGKADGFFIFGNLAVIYDCTLEGGFEEAKAQQIENYCAQLKGGRLERGESVYEVGRHQKQVWIITRGTPRIIKRIDDITVKEVPVQELIKIYKKRMEEDVSEEELEKLLAASEWR
jgi:hypothetical protein